MVMRRKPPSAGTSASITTVSANAADKLQIARMPLRHHFEINQMNVIDEIVEVVGINNVNDVPDVMKRAERAGKQLGEMLNCIESR